MQLIFNEYWNWPKSTQLRYARDAACPSRNMAAGSDYFKFPAVLRKAHAGGYDGFKRLACMRLKAQGFDVRTLRDRHHRHLAAINRSFKDGSIELAAIVDSVRILANESREPNWDEYFPDPFHTLWEVYVHMEATRNVRHNLITLGMDSDLSLRQPEERLEEINGCLLFLIHQEPHVFNNLRHLSENYADDLKPSLEKAETRNLFRFLYGMTQEILEIAPEFTDELASLDPLKHGCEPIAERVVDSWNMFQVESHIAQQWLADPEDFWN